MQTVCESQSNARSKSLYEKAQRYIPGGVNSPVRAFNAVGGVPRFIQSAKGAYVTDVDGNQYVDYIGSWGPMVLGHAHPEVLQAAMDTAQNGLSFGAPCELEVKMAEMIVNRIPSIEKVRMVNSGTEATMSAIRLARGATGRSKIIKFEGCYHGHSDGLLVKAGSGLLTFGAPSSPGVTPGCVADTLTARFNDLDSVTALFESQGGDIAAIILEPIAGNMNLILPKPGFLQGLRELCDQYGALLIFDEVISGFRVSMQGAQGLYPVTPDLTTYGKIIGGGMPVGAFGGRREIMAQLSPEGAVYQAGTLSGNPIAMAAGLKTLELLTAEAYEQINETTEQLVQGLKQRAEAANIAFTMNSVCGIFGMFFTQESSIEFYEQVSACDQTRFRQFFHVMLNRGVHFGPSSFESAFVSLAHGKVELDLTFKIAEEAFAELG